MRDWPRLGKFQMPPAHLVTVSTQVHELFGRVVELAVVVLGLAVLNVPEECLVTDRLVALNLVGQ
jgi:hypothetical protein